MIRVELDSVWRPSGATTGRRVNRARACGIEVVGDLRVIAAVARRLVAAGHDPETAIEVWRNGTPVFTAAPLGAWAEDRRPRPAERGCAA